jgi:hypothetical protein
MSGYYLKPITKRRLEFGTQGCTCESGVIPRFIEAFLFGTYGCIENFNELDLYIFSSLWKIISLYVYDLEVNENLCV